jgi:hypothetical protein
MALNLRPIPGGVVIAVKVVPGASRDQIAGLLGDRLKIRTAAPPEDGKANAAIRALLARALGVPLSCVHVVSGSTRPLKEIEVRSIDIDRFRAALSPHLPAD